MALDCCALHGVDRHPGARAQRGQPLRARLSIPVHLRCRGETLGLRRSMQVGRRAGAVAGTVAAQRRDGGTVSGELLEVPGPGMTPAAGLAASLEARVWAALAEINDPEMPVNLVDLGLIYGLEIGEGTVRLRLTFTAMGCPASDMIVGDIRERLLAEPGVGDVLIDVVWDPPWSAARLTPDGREALLAWGLSV